MYNEYFNEPKNIYSNGNINKNIYQNWITLRNLVNSLKRMDLSTKNLKHPNRSLRIR